MTRFSAFLLFAVLTVFSFSAQAEKLDPPLQGDMARLEVMPYPKTIPEVIVASADKDSISLRDYRTKLVVLNVWATWCPPCIEELPSLNALEYAMGDNLFQVVTVSLDKDGIQSIKKYMGDNNLKKLTPYVDTKESVLGLDLMRDVPAIPVSLILDPQNRVIARLQGPADWNGPDARKVLEYYAKHVSYAPVD